MRTWSNQKTHYAWIVLLGCCLMQGISLGAVTNICGIYYVPICRELGFSTAQLSSYRSVACIVAMFGMSVFSRLLKKHDSRIVLTAGVLMLTLPTLAMGTFHHLWQWYLFGAIQGFSANFIGVVASALILGNWFHKKTGFAIGLSTATSGLIAAVSNYMISRVIDMWGWRTAYFINGAVSLALLLPATLLLIRYHPSDMGLTAYGTEQKSVPATSISHRNEAHHADEKSSIPMLILCSICVAIPAGFISFFNAFGLSIGMSISDAALLASLSMLGNSLGKLFVGEMNDHLGTRIPTLFAYSFSIAGAAGLLLTGVPLIYLAAPMFGFSMPLYTTLMPLITRAVVGKDSFSNVFPTVAMVMTFTVAIMTTVHGWLFDQTGSYTASLLISIFTLAIGMIVSALLLRKKSTRCNAVLLDKTA